MPAPPSQTSSAREVVNRATTSISRRDAELLLRHVLGWDTARLRAYPEHTLTPDALTAFFRLVDARATDVPIQYLTGQQEFYGLPLHVSPAVLIPRPETEGLIEAVLSWAAGQPTGMVQSIVDVGTGSGAIALALATHLPAATVHALDLSPAVQSVVEGNAARLGLAARVRFQHSDLLSALSPRVGAGERFDAVVSNPPYIPLTDAGTLAPEVRDHEPHLALFAGEDGLDVYRRLLPQAWLALRFGGLLAVEFGYGQHEALATLLSSWRHVRILNDLAGIPRVALAQRGEEQA